MPVHNFIKRKMKNNIEIAVIGGTGKSGKYLVQELLNQGYNFKALVRNPKNFKVENDLVEVVHGNVNDYKTVLSFIEGCEVVISTLGLGIPYSEPTIFSTACKNIVQAMNELGLKRYIVVTGLNVDTPFDEKGPKSKFATDWMYTNYPKSTLDRQREYDLMVESELDWTLVRLPIIELTDNRKKKEASLEDCLGDNISATDLATFLIEQIEDESFHQKAPFLANV